MPPTDDASEPLYPPFLAAPPEPLSLPAYFVNFVRNPLGVMPAVVYREPIFQYRGRLTYVTDPQLVKRILLDEFNDFPKTIIERYVFTRLLGKGILTAHGAEWRWQRQAAAPLFRHAEIQRYAPVMTDAAERVIADWRRLPPRRHSAASIKTRRAPRSASSPRRCCTATIRPSQPRWNAPIATTCCRCHGRASMASSGCRTGCPIPRKSARRSRRARHARIRRQSRAGAARAIRCPRTI